MAKKDAKYDMTSRKRVENAKHFREQFLAVIPEVTKTSWIGLQLLLVHFIYRYNLCKAIFRNR